MVTISTEDIPTHVEIVGLRRSENGRSCPIHPEACGVAVDLGSLIHLKMVTVDLGDGRLRWAVACVLFENGGEGCRVGFLPLVMVHVREQLHNRFAQVVELYRNHENKAHRAFDYHNHGAGQLLLLDAVPDFE
ncbi:hypothetical protein HDU76_002364 [Blyttiomyces sp. JEL0837]|nr:hypothetical protein HDU76_002364 [Blyttiomyces sp. JEL0837]